MTGSPSTLSSLMPFLQMMMQKNGGNNPFSSPAGGAAPNMAPQIPTSTSQNSGGMARQLPMPQQQPQVPGGAIGAASNGFNNLSNLYSGGNKVYNGLFGSSPQAGGQQPSGMNFTGASPMSGQQNAQNFMGPQTMPNAGSQQFSGAFANGTGTNFTGYNMAGPSNGGMFGGQNASFMGNQGMFGANGANGMSGPMFANMGQNAGAFGGQGAGASDAAGTLGGNVAATDTASSSSPSWLSQLWDYL